MIPILIAGTLACSVFDVGPVSFLDTTVVCNILPLSVNTVNLFVSDNTITNFVTMTKKNVSLHSSRVQGKNSCRIG